MRTKIAAMFAVSPFLVSCAQPVPKLCEWDHSIKIQASIEVPVLISDNLVLSNWKFEPAEPEQYEYSSGSSRCFVQVKEKHRDSMFAVVYYDPAKREFGEVKNVEIVE